MMLVISVVWFSILATCSTLESLSTKEFQKVIHENEIVLAAFTSKAVKFTEPFHIEFAQAAATLTSPLVIVDCVHESTLCHQYDVNAYPAVRLFRGSNESSTYRGPRKAPAIVSYMIKEQLPPVTHVNEKTIVEFREIDDVVIVAYVDPQDTELIDVFSAFAKEHHDEYVFGIATDAELAQVNNLPVPSVTCFKIREGDNTAMNGRFDEDSLENFLAMAAPPKIGEITKRNIDTYLSPRTPIAYIFVSSEDERTDLRRELNPIAKKYGQYMSFGFVDAAEYSHMATNMDLRPGIFPAFVIHNVRSDEVFPFDQRRKITGAAIDRFVIDVSQGKVRMGPVVYNDNLGEDELDGFNDSQWENAGEDELDDEAFLSRKHDEL